MERTDVEKLWAIEPTEKVCTEPRKAEKRKAREEEEEEEEESGEKARVSVSTKVSPPQDDARMPDI